MTAILLDTNILLPVYARPETVEEKLAAFIEGADECYFSVLSLWEMVLLHNKNRIKLKSQINDIAANLIEYNRFRQAGLDAETIGIYAQLPNIKNHKDPFDRMLAATALHYGWTIVTTDAQFKKYGCKLFMAKGN
jgi:PIN domain nuclease of toxin-antitoxin system